MFPSAPEEIIAWFGPAIGPNAFQVGKEVIEQFMAFDPIAETAFRPDPNEAGKYLGNLYQIATQRLNKLGITQIYGGEHCTFTEKETFFFLSSRRQNWPNGKSNLDKKNKLINTTNRTLKCGLFLAYSEYFRTNFLKSSKQRSHRLCLY